MTNELIETAIHQNEVECIEDFEKTPEFRALCIKSAGEAIAASGEILRLAALGQLGTADMDIFGETQSASDQVNDAKLTIQRHLAILIKHA